jgi:hypothetical protein
MIRSPISRLTWAYSVCNVSGRPDMPRLLDAGQEYQKLEWMSTRRTIPPGVEPRTGKRYAGD